MSTIYLKKKITKLRNLEISETFECKIIKMHNLQHSKCHLTINELTQFRFNVVNQLENYHKSINKLK